MQREMTTDEALVILAVKAEDERRGVFGSSVPLEDVLTAYQVILASYQQISRFLRRNGFSDFSSFEDAHAQMTEDLEAAVSDIEKMLEQSTESGLCEYCHPESTCVCSTEGTCHPKWRGAVCTEPPAPPPGDLPNGGV